MFQLLKPIKASHRERHHLPPHTHTHTHTHSVSPPTAWCLFNMAFQYENSISCSRLYKGTANAVLRQPPPPFAITLALHTHTHKHTRTHTSPVLAAAACWHSPDLTLPQLRNGICFISLFNRPHRSSKLSSTLHVLSKIHTC